MILHDLSTKIYKIMKKAPGTSPDAVMTGHLFAAHLALNLFYHALDHITANISRFF